jgi:SAM-dependent methyltransferase
MKNYLAISFLMNKLKNKIKDIARPIYYWTKNVKDYFYLITNLSLPKMRYDLIDLYKMDQLYQGMHNRHIKVHQGVIQEIYPKQTVLEIGCGTGHAISLFLKNKLNYSGLDISETAISVASLKYPELNFYNLSIIDTKFFPDNTFDVVYCSSVIEHIGFFELAIKNMLRISRKQVYIVFFGGLSDATEHYFEFHPFTDRKLLSGEKNGEFGRKLVLQESHVTREVPTFKQDAGNFYLSGKKAADFLDIAERELNDSVLASRLQPWKGKYDFRSLLKEHLDSKGVPSVNKLKKVPNFIKFGAIRSDEKGYFMNVYSKNKVKEFLDAIGCTSYKIMDSSNTPFIKSESVLMIEK